MLPPIASSCYAWNAAAPQANPPGSLAINVTKTIPSYLRVHREADDNTSSARKSLSDFNNPIQDFWDIYARSTGWRIDQRQSRDGEIELISTVETCTSEDPEAGNVVRKSDATELASAARLLSEELNEARAAIRRQEAELAVRATILSGQAEQTNLADQLESTLADAAVACGCDAATLFMLDAETRFLKAHAVFGLPPQRLEAPKRELRGSRGDLEAMVRGVVTINDLNECDLDTWNCPEDAAAAICAVILNDDVPVGTLWLYANDTKEFGLQESAAVRLVTTQLSTMLSQAAADTTPTGSAPSNEAISEVAQWQFEALPIGAHLADGWRVDGMIESPQAWATGFHNWDVLPDGTLMLVIAEAVDDSAKGAMASTIARSALAAHAGYRHTPAQLLQRVSDTLWQTSTGEQLMSMLYARVDPETGEGEVATAGTISAMISSRYGYRPVTSGNGDPLNQHIDARIVTESFRMMTGETLLAYSPGMATGGINQARLGDSLRSAMQAGDLNPLAALRRNLADMPLNCERGAVSLMRV